MGLQAEKNERQGENDIAEEDSNKAAVVVEMERKREHCLIISTRRRARREGQPSAPPPPLFASDLYVIMEAPTTENPGEKTPGAPSGPASASRLVGCWFQNSVMGGFPDSIHSAALEDLLVGDFTLRAFVRAEWL